MPLVSRWITSIPTASTTSVTASTIWWSDTGTSAATSPYWPWASQTNTITQTALTQACYTAVDQANYQEQCTAQLLNAQMQEQYYGLQTQATSGLGSLFGSDDWAITAIGNRQLYHAAAPAIITHREQERLDREAYQRAVDEHRVQEAERIMRQIEARQLATAEQRRLQELRDQEHRERHAQTLAAKAVARELLLEHLNASQRETFERNGWFIVEGGRTKTKYRVRADEHMIANVDVMVGDRRTHRLCAHARVGTVPLGDQLLSQKIMLELAEDDFLRIANRHAA